MSRLFNTDRPAPYERTPTDSLVFIRGGASESSQVTSPLSHHQPSVPSSPSPPTRGTETTTTQVVRELDEQTGFRILDYIYERGGSVNIDDGGTTPVKRATPAPPISQAHNRNTFYIPPNTTSTGSVGGTTTTTAGTKVMQLFDALTESLSFKTMSNVRKINKRVLQHNGITVETLIAQCRVAITNLYQARIVTSMRDLVELGFKTSDLLLDRTLFNCNTLCTLFGVRADDGRRNLPMYRVMVGHGVDFSLEHLMMNDSFLSSELMTLEFPLGEMIEADGIGRGQLLALKFPCAELVQLGLTKKHLKKLKISERHATEPRQPDGQGGFGWTIEEYRSLR